MFDIGFPELVLVSIVALLVIGPERLPETIRTVMLWIGRVRKTFTNIKTELEQELGADEIRRQLHNEGIMKDIRESKEKISDALKEADQSIDEFKHSISESIDTSKASVEKAINKPADGKIDPPQSEAEPKTTTQDSSQNREPEPLADNSENDEPERRTH
jgi:sec-independent protein translocase protein TatB